MPALVFVALKPIFTRRSKRPFKKLCRVHFSLPCPQHCCDKILSPFLSRRLEKLHQYDADLISACVASWAKLRFWVKQGRTLNGQQLSGIKWVNYVKYGHFFSKRASLLHAEVPFVQLATKKELTRLKVTKLLSY
jgi:hypothetical protein